MSRDEIDPEARALMKKRAQELAAEAPPLTDEQKAVLRRLLRPMASRYGAGAA